MRSLLVLSLFFGLISMILPKDRQGNLVKLILIVVLFLSVGNFFLGEEWSIPEIVSEEISILEQSPQKIALHNAVSARVSYRTGSPPISVESDLVCEEDSSRLTVIRVVIGEGNCEEVFYDLSKEFAFEGFVVTKE